MGKVNIDCQGKAVSDLIFGVGSVHRLPFRRQRTELLQQALDMGFRNFDVAPAYGNGLNELALGMALNGFRTSCKITTKFGIPIDLYGARHPGSFLLLRGFHQLFDKSYAEEYKQRVFNENEMVSSLEGSLKRLNCDYVDDFLIHEPLGLIQNEDLMGMHEKAQRMKEQGKIIRWGIAGPAISLTQFEKDSFIDVFQFPLADIEKLSLPPLSRKTVYGVYHFYKAKGFEKKMPFADFVKMQCVQTGANLVVATKSPATLATFRDCF